MKKISISVLALFVIIFAFVTFVNYKEVQAVACPSGQECVWIDVSNVYNNFGVTPGPSGYNFYNDGWTTPNHLCQLRNYNLYMSDAVLGTWSSLQDNHHVIWSGSYWYGQNATSSKWLSQIQCSRPLPTGTISASCGTESSPCIIPSGGSSTTVSLTWSVTNPQGSSSINGTTVTSSPVSFTPANTSDTIYSLVNNNQTLDSVGPIKVECAEGTTWNNTSCVSSNDPTISWTSNSASGSVASGASYYIGATGSDTDGDLFTVKIDRQVGTNNVEAFAHTPASGSTYTTGNNTSNTGPVTVIYTAYATDNANNNSQTITKTITVNAPPTAPTAPVAALSASPNPVGYGARSTLTWASIGATSCTAGGPWSNQGTLSGEGWTDPLYSNTTFTFYCTGAGGTSLTQSVTVLVGAAPQVNVVNGSCSTTHYGCNAGTSANNSDNSTNWTWNCNGSGGGTNASCSENKSSRPPVDGECGEYHYDCNEGSSGDEIDDGGAWNWTCYGEYGGSDDSCSERKPPSAFSLLSISVNPTTYSVTLPSSTISATYILTNGTSTNTNCRLLDYQGSPLNSYASCTGSMSVTAPAAAGSYGYSIQAFKSSTSETKTSNGFTVTVNSAVTHTLTVTKNGTGTVLSDIGGINCGITCSASYVPGSSVTLNIGASATSGMFAGWSGAGCSGTSTCTILMNSAKNVTATFISLPDLKAYAASPTTATAGTAQTYRAYISNIGNISTVTSFYNFFQSTTDLTDPRDPATISDYTRTSIPVLEAGATVNVTSPSITFTSPGTYSVRLCADKSSSSISGWIPESDEENNCGPWTNVTVSNAPVTTYTLTVSKSGTGTVVSNIGGINCGSTCSDNYYISGSSVTLGASTTSGTFSGWSGAGCSGTSECTILMNSDKNVTATFTAPPALTCPNGANNPPTCTTTGGGGVCPTGYTGTYPNCVGGGGAGVCPTGYTGTYPNCTGPSGGICPTTYTGTYPNCVGSPSDPVICIYGATNPPACSSFSSQRRPFFFED